MPKRHRPTGIDEAQATWLAAQPPYVKPNPCIRLYGLGPEGRTCGECSHLFGERYHKCDLRTVTNGAATDHKVRWPSCGKFTEREVTGNGIH